MEGFEENLGKLRESKLTFADSCLRRIERKKYSSGTDK